MRHRVAASLNATAFGVVLALAACGSVTGKHLDGGGTGGTHADSAAKMDLAPDQRAEDARHDAVDGRDARSGEDMSLADARPTDARMTDARNSDAGAKGGAGGGGGMSGGGMSGGAGSGAGGTGGECQSNGDCVLYPKLGGGCCGVCQPKSEPQPPPVQCLIACLTPLISCGCVNQQCVGSTKQL